MTGPQYKAHLATLGLTQSQAAAWLGVSVRTQRRYEKNGPEGPAARAVGLAAAISALDDTGAYSIGGEHVPWDKIASLLAVPPQDDAS